MLKSFYKFFTIVSIFTILWMFVIGLYNGQWMLGLLVGLLLNVFFFVLADKIILYIYKPKLIPQQKALSLYSITEGIAAKVSISTPKLFFVDTLQPNIFSIGLYPRKGKIILSGGLLKNLTPQELEAVIACEVANIKNYTSALRSFLAISSSSLSIIFNWGMLFSPFNPDINSPNTKIGNFCNKLFAPIQGFIIKVGSNLESCKNNDVFAVKYLNCNIEALAFALRKLDIGSKQTNNFIASAIPGLSVIYAVSPIQNHDFAKYYKSHINTKNRIISLAESITKQSINISKNNTQPKSSKKSKKSFIPGNIDKPVIGRKAKDRTGGGPARSSSIKK